MAGESGRAGVDSLVVDLQVVDAVFLTSREARYGRADIIDDLSPLSESCSREYESHYTNKY